MSNKTYKLFDRTPNGDLCSYNQVNKSVFNGFLLKYEQGEWREPEIRGTALFCLNKIPDAIDRIINNDETVELWEVEAEGTIERDDIVFSGFSYSNENELKELVKKQARGDYSNAENIELLFETFPDVVCFERVKPIQRVL